MSEKPIFIRTEVSILRPVMMSDVDILLVWANKPELRDFLAFTAPVMEPFERKWIERLSEDSKNFDNMVFIIETLEREPIGTMGLHGINMKDRHATTGAMIGEQKYWGKGIGEITKMHLLNYAFNYLGLNRVNSHVIAHNKRSLNYSLRCGYKVEGLRRQMHYKNGKYWDDIVLGLLKKDWLPIWRRYQRTGKLK